MPLPLKFPGSQFLSFQGYLLDAATRLRLNHPKGHYPMFFVYESCHHLFHSFLFPLNTPEHKRLSALSVPCVSTRRIAQGSQIGSLKYKRGSGSFQPPMCTQRNKQIDFVHESSCSRGHHINSVELRGTVRLRLLGPWVHGAI